MHAQGQVGNNQIGGQGPRTKQGAQHRGDTDRDDPAHDRRRRQRDPEQGGRVAAGHQAAHVPAQARGPAEHHADDDQLRQPVDEAGRAGDHDGGPVGRLGLREQGRPDEHGRQGQPRQGAGPVLGHQVAGQATQASQRSLIPNGEHGDHCEDRRDRTGHCKEPRVDERKTKVPDERPSGGNKAGEHRA